jgi:hypothetical protein
VLGCFLVHVVAMLMMHGFPYDSADDIMKAQ